jgi:hypothetical protein
MYLTLSRSATSQKERVMCSSSTLPALLLAPHCCHLVQLLQATKQHATAVACLLQYLSHFQHCRFQQPCCECQDCKRRNKLVALSNAILSHGHVLHAQIMRSCKRCGVSSRVLQKGAVEPNFHSKINTI